jgi:hypothetical protein
LQRKVRGVVRSSTQQEAGGKGPNIVTRLKGGNANSTASQEQEARTIAERYHLLSNHVVRKVLPSKVPTVDSTFLLLLYCHESMWDRVAEIADQSAKTAGLIIDVNKHKPLSTVPSPCSPRLDEVPEVPPPGVSFHALTFLVGLALRKYSVDRFGW